MVLPAQDTSWEQIVGEDVFCKQSPLERIVGFDIAEETYDALTFREQIVIDLLVSQFTQGQIASVFGVSQPSISSTIRRIRVKLATGKLHMVLEMREEYRYGTHGNVQN